MEGQMKLQHEFKKGIKESFPKEIPFATKKQSMSVHACVCVHVCKDIKYLHVDMGGKRTFICVQEETEARGRTHWTRIMELGLEKLRTAEDGHRTDQEDFFRIRSQNETT